MRISRKDWNDYTASLSRLEGTAAGIMERWMEANPGTVTDDMLSVANLLANTYGEASAALACEMYDAIAAAQGAALDPAIPAQPATYQETARAVQGAVKTKTAKIPAVVGELVRMAAADAMLQNAKRDGAEFAWVPNGDTCAFCLVLASRGWQRAGKNSLKSGHAEHIHANCDCTYAVRFDGKSTVEGYDREKYLEQYKNAAGSTPQEKINSIRRTQYAENKDKINAQKRAAYAVRKEREQTGKTK